MIALLLYYPPPIQAARRILSGYYTDTRTIIQFLPECAQYDGDLG